MSLELVLGSGVREDGRGVDGYRHGMFLSKHGAKKQKTKKKTRFFLEGARVYLGENVTTKSLNTEHFMFSDESKFILS